MSQSEGSTVTRQQYLEILAEALELEEPLHENTAITDIPGWDSMAQIIVIANTQMATGIQLQLSDLVRCTRVKDIISLLGSCVEAE